MLLEAPPGRTATAGPPRSRRACSSCTVAVVISSTAGLVDAPVWYFWWDSHAATPEASAGAT